jgi:predicted nucleic acid-binding protein
VAAFIFDASAIVERYLKETGSSWVQRLADPAVAHELLLTRVGRVEVIGAVARRGRGNAIPVFTTAALIAQFRHDAAHQYNILKVPPRCSPTRNALRNATACLLRLSQRA